MDKTEKTLIGLSIFSAVCYIAGLIVVVYLVFQGVDYVREYGIKSIAERIWEGPKTPK